MATDRLRQRGSYVGPAYRRPSRDQAPSPTRPPTHRTEQHPRILADDKAILRWLRATEDHPFWNATDQEFQRADQLDRGDQLLGPDGQLARVIGIRSGSQKVATAYNLTVDGIHTYYVLAGTTPVLVHNICPISGLKSGISADEVGVINRGYGGEYLLSGSFDNTLINASRYDSFWDKSAVIVRDVAGGHMFNNGNKRTAQAIVERLMERSNIVSGPTSADLRGVIDRVGKGQLSSVEDISAALRGF
jgi:hypothetical protein